MKSCISWVILEENSAVGLMIKQLLYLIAEALVSLKLANVSPST